jgi:hypothetical protein
MSTYEKAGKKGHLEKGLELAYSGGKKTGL